MLVRLTIGLGRWLKGRILVELHFAQTDILGKREPSFLVFPVSIAQHCGKYSVPLKLSAVQPSRLDNVLTHCLRGRSVENASDQATSKPNFALARVRIEELLNVCDLQRFYLEPTFLEYFALRSIEKIFPVVGSTARRDPKVIHTNLAVANEQNASIVFDDDAGCDSMIHRRGLTFDVSGVRSMEGLGVTVILWEEVPFDEFNENVQDLDV